MLGEWELFELIIFQLLGNAVKFSNMGACITISVEVLKSQSQYYLKTSVIDCGTGILQGKLDSIRRAL